MLHVHVLLSLLPRQIRILAGHLRWGHPLTSLLSLWMLSPLMFGHNVSSVHHCHTWPAEVLWWYICVKLCHHRAVIWCHTTPWPIVRDPGIGQALPHYHTVACQRKDTRRWKVSKHVRQHADFTCNFVLCRLDLRLALTDFRILFYLSQYDKNVSWTGQDQLENRLGLFLLWLTWLGLASIYFLSYNLRLNLDLSKLWLHLLLMTSDLKFKSPIQNHLPE